MLDRQRTRANKQIKNVFLIKMYAWAYIKIQSSTCSNPHFIVFHSFIDIFIYIYSIFNEVIKGHVGQIFASPLSPFPVLHFLSALLAPRGFIAHLAAINLYLFGSKRDP